MNEFVGISIWLRVKGKLDGEIRSLHEDMRAVMKDDTRKRVIRQMLAEADDKFAVREPNQKRMSIADKLEFALKHKIRPSDEDIRRAIILLREYDLLRKKVARKPK